MLNVICTCMLAFIVVVRYENYYFLCRWRVSTVILASVSTTQHRRIQRHVQCKHMHAPVCPSVCLSGCLSGLLLVITVWSHVLTRPPFEGHFLDETGLAGSPLFCFFTFPEENFCDKWYRFSVGKVPLRWCQSTDPKCGLIWSFFIHHIRQLSEEALFSSHTSQTDSYVSLSHFMQLCKYRCCWKSSSKFVVGYVKHQLTHGE